MYHGELWTAVIDEGEAEPGEEVIINKTDGLKLIVSKEIKKETEGGN